MRVRRRRTVVVNWTDSYRMEHIEYSQRLTLTLLSRQDTQAMVACLLLAKDLGVGIFLFHFFSSHCSARLQISNGVD